MSNNPHLDNLIKHIDDSFRQYVSSTFIKILDTIKQNESTSKKKPKIVKGKITIGAVGTCCDVAHSLIPEDTLPLAQKITPSCDSLQYLKKAFSRRYALFYYPPNSYANFETLNFKFFGEFFKTKTAKLFIDLLSKDLQAIGVTIISFKRNIICTNATIKFSCDMSRFI